MILFTVNDLFTMHIYDGNGRKTPKYMQMKTIPPSTEMEADCFRCPKTPKTSRTYPRWDGGPSLVGKEIYGLGIAQRTQSVKW